MSEDKRTTLALSGNTSREDVKQIIDTIVDDNKFELQDLMKECDIAASTKKFTLEHLSIISKVKGYELLVKQPGEAPAVAMEHGQGPQVDGMGRQVPLDDVAHGVQIGAPVAIDHALGVARGAGGIVQRDRLPFIPRRVPGMVVIAGLQEGLVTHLAQ